MEQYRPIPRQDTSWPKSKESQEPELRVETLGICPKCGEPVLGSHKCGELSEIIADLGPDHPAAKYLLQLLEKTKQKAAEGEDTSGVRGLDEDDEPRFRRAERE